jgi:hypothetical protein
MSKKPEIKKLEKKIADIKSAILNLDELRPGSLGEQYNVCGNPNCRCKDKKNPQKHGPYYQLSYSWQKKSTSEFIRKEDVEATKKFMNNYKIFMELKDDWIGCSIQLSKLRKQK